MKAQMQIVYFDKNKRIIDDRDKKKIVHFRFSLIAKKLDVWEDKEWGIETGYTDLQIISESEIMEIKDGTIYNHHFVSLTWGLEIKGDIHNLFIYNTIIDL